MSKIDSLKMQLAERDTHAAAPACAPQQASDAVAVLRTQVVDDHTALAAMSSSVEAAKAETSAQTTTLNDLKSSTEALRKSVEEPAALRYKGITIVPGGFLAAEVCGGRGR